MRVVDRNKVLINVGLTLRVLSEIITLHNYSQVSCSSNTFAAYSEDWGTSLSVWLYLLYKAEKPSVRPSAFFRRQAANSAVSASIDFRLA